MQRRNFLRTTTFAATGAALAPAAKLVAKAADQEQRPNILFIYIDDMGWMDLGCMGSKYYESPNVDRLATEGVFFRTLISQSPWTVPSHFSLLSSTYPHVNKGNQPIQELKRSWDNSIPMAAQLLSSKGYKSAAFTGRGSISAKFGFFRGFDLYHESTDIGRDAKQNFDRAIAWLRKNPGPQ